MFRSIPTVTKNLLIVNFLVFVASLILERMNLDLGAMGGLHFFMADDFHLFQFLTYMFLHSTVSFTHILFNMFALWMFGCVVENVWGPKKFLFYYISCGVGAGVIQELVQWLTMVLFPDMQMEVELVGGGTMMIPYAQYLLQLSNMVGASGAIYAILLAFGMIFPNERIFIFPLPVPIKAKWFVAGYAVLELVFAISSSSDGVAHTAHLGGMLIGFLLIRYWNRQAGTHFNRSNGKEFFQRWNSRNQRSSNKTNSTRRTSFDEPTYTASTDQNDMAYNARKRKNQEEVDAILDKIRKSGYDSLTKEEKRRLFDASQDR